MPYLYNTPEDQQEMLQAIGAASVEDLFAPIPRELQRTARSSCRRRCRSWSWISICGGWGR